MIKSLQDNIESPKAAKMMIYMVFVAAAVIILIGAVIYRSFAAVPFAFGVLITSGLNVIKLRMLVNTVQQVVEMDDIEAGKNKVRLQYLLRYLLTGIVLVAVALIDNFTTPPPIFSERNSYFAVWAILFPNGPESLLTAPLINIMGALAGIFTMQLSIFIVRFMKLEKDGTEFIKYEDDEEDIDIEEPKSDENIIDDDEINIDNTDETIANKDDLP